MRLLSLYSVFYAGSLFLYVLRIAILVYCVMSWFVTSRNRLLMWLKSFISPFVNIFRGMAMWLMHKTRMPVDITYILALIGISVTDWLWWKIYHLLRLIR